MKKFFALVFAVGSLITIHAQDSSVVSNITDTTPLNSIDTAAIALPIITPDSSIENSSPAPSPKKSLPLDLTSRTKDHLLLQIGLDKWGGLPDSIKTKGLSRSFAIYFMFDFPFKTNPKLSIGLGIGIFTSSMYFSNTAIDITGKNANRLGFRNVGDTTRFKKYKLMTTYLEAPVELRYVADPVHPKKSFKAAAGLKIGTMLGAGTKGKNLLSSSGQSINNYTEKLKSKKYFNSTRLAVTGRVGYGNLSVFGNYQVNAFIKDGFGPDVRPYTVGLTISGL